MRPSSSFGGRGDYSIGEVLWRDGERAVYRGWRSDADDGLRAVLLVVVAADNATPAILDRLRHEYELRDDLDSAWAVRPLELVRDHDRPMLVLEYLGGEPLDRLIGAPMEIGRFLEVAAALSAALARLHQRGFIHKDVKPANVLVDAASAQVRLTGFGIASRLPREHPSPEPPEFIAGTLPYMAPEQTGRMNHSIDSRSDLYSLGVTLYEMLTGNLPFTASDPMGWVHCHIARQPTPPHERSRTVPLPISAIIMRLLAKTAEERYQTATGVEADLRRCLLEWSNGRRIGEFPLGERDTPAHLRIPEKLYGRASEVGILVAAFERVVAGGRPELLLISGYAGVGKSAVVNEIHKALVQSRGLFASGKSDQYNRDVPYAPLAQALQGTVRFLLGRSETELDDWRSAFREALGPNARLILDLVPELKLIIGEQPPVPELPPGDAQRRFQLVFRRFIGVFARPEHPLVLFLDDLQWLDAATLDLLEDLLTQRDVERLLLIGAYRDNEVDASHLLNVKLEGMRAKEAKIRGIVLAPLTRSDLQRLISASLRCEMKLAAPLAGLVHEKTLGNPFFAIQFISELAEEGLLTFDHRAAQWSWDLHRIHGRGYTDNVVDLMVGKLSRLSTKTQSALQLLACIGNSADCSFLAMAYEGLGEDLHSDLQEAVQTGLVFRSENAYTFLHDRVQEATYSQIAEEARGPAHLRIGRVLASRIKPEEIPARIFDIVNQLNRGSWLIASLDERIQFARLNLLAGERARTSTAYASAIEYLAAGRAMLTEEAWNRDHDLIFDLEFQMAQCELLTANMTAAEHRLSMLAQRARRAQDVAAVTRWRVTLFTTLDRSDRAVEVCLDYLQRGGTDWSPHPTPDQVQREYDRILSQLGACSIEAIADLPLMTDREALATLDVLTEAATPAAFTDENLLLLVICRMVNLSLEHGNSDGSCFAYVSLGANAGARFGDYETGFRFGRLGYDLVEKRGLHRFQARTCLMFAHNVMPWTRHVRAGRDLIHRAFEIANRKGDFTYAAYSQQDLIRNLLVSGEPLGDTQREAEKCLDFAQRARFGLVIDIITVQLCLVRTLRGLTPEFGRFDDDQFEELRFERHLANDGRLAHSECLYWIRKLQARFLAADYASATRAASRAQLLLWASRRSPFEVMDYEFYAALSRAAHLDAVSSDERQLHLDELAAHHRRLASWAAHCPDNIEARAALVGGEIARIESRDLDAERLYERAIRSARGGGFVHVEGVANETAGRFYLARGLETNAYAHLRNASACFAQWGADGKVAQLESLYPRLAPPGGRQPETTSVRQLDVATVVKASQALSSEMLLPKLVEQLMTITLQNAGADRGLLLLPKEDGYHVEAEAWASGNEIILRQGSGADPSAPETITRYVIRAQEKVILDDALKPNLFSEDEYLSSRRPRSILCLPLLRQGTLAGLLYLENKLTSQVFTLERVAMLEVLASQAAISLVNTSLYSDLQEREAKVRSLIDSNIIGICTWGLNRRITDANEAFLRIVGHALEDLVSGRLGWRDLTPAEWHDADARCRAELKATGVGQPYEKEYFHKSGSRVPVLVGAANFEGSQHEGVAFVVDLTDRKRVERAARESERRYREIEIELAHANRVATTGQLSASIAHEVNQPIAAAVTNAQVALRWLDAEPQNLEKVRQALGRVIKNGNRAGNVVNRIRAFIKKAPPQKNNLEINEALLEVIALTRNEAAKNDISVQTHLAEGLPIIQADRVQLQQVILNLIINAIEAMGEMGEGSRELTIRTAETGSEGVFVEVCDSGPGLSHASLERLFEAFYSTKPNGLGMGLSICRSIIEAHGGRLWATANVPQGAIFQFTLPVHAVNES